VAEVRRQRSESKNDFMRGLNVMMDGASLSDSGMAFQMTGDEWENLKARWPIVRFARRTVKMS